ncbi:hypothetical protein AURDEDRAFT_157883 [Auricularia subglabra TFB-10046 SS5]|nr:hypothetical protein AURDEDRAFT_157883 [Auricularia subglabra TFB-10046 SS5]
MPAGARSTRQTPPHSPPAQRTASFSSTTYANASEEKAALAYHEARRAVERHQSVSHHEDAPVPYEALFPSRSTSVSHSRPSSPPAIAATSSKARRPSSPDNVSAYASAAAEKERIRRAFEARDAALSGGAPSTPPTSTSALPSTIRAGSSHPASPAPQQTSFNIADQPPPFESIASTPAFDPTIPEKERIRRAFEARDQAAQASGVRVAPHASSSSAGIPRKPSFPTASATATPNGSTRSLSPAPSIPSVEPAGVARQPPPRSFSPSLSSEGHSSVTSSRRPQPAPPAVPGLPRPLTAAEEKARLKAQYAAEDAEVAASSISGSSKPPQRPTTASSIVEPRDPAIKQGKMREVLMPPVPPPLMPRPPREYIQETMRRDTQSQEQLAKLLQDPSMLELRSTSPIPALPTAVPPPPPLPPKIPLSE